MVVLGVGVDRGVVIGVGLGIGLGVLVKLVKFGERLV